MKKGYPIKAISLWEPWASLVATGNKDVETRSWKTKYTGELLICAAQKGLSRIELLRIMADPNFKEGLLPIVEDNISIKQRYCTTTDLNFGRAVAIVELIDCVPTKIFKHSCPVLYKFNEPFGNFDEGRYAWVFKNIRMIKPEFRFFVKGRQGFFNYNLPFEPYNKDYTDLVRE